jgi:long-chain acyl-CoA synthetase
MIFDVEPDRDALVHGEDRLTFGQLRRRVDDAARDLAALEDGVVILDAQSDPETVVRFLALRELGKPVALFSSTWTSHEIEVRRSMLGKASHLGADGTVVWSSATHEIAHHPEAAVILFTSGSTGAPRAVQLSQPNIDANTGAVLDTLDFEQAAEQTLFLPLSYSYGLLGQLVPALEVGVTTRLLPQFNDARVALETSRARGMWSGVATHWEALLRLTDPPPENTAEVTHVVSAGAPLSTDLRTRLRHRFPEATLYNNYGQTEAGPRVLSFSSRHPSFFEGFVGYPVGDFEIAVTDDDELLLRGSQIMPGYLGDEEATADKIRDGWLYTGDAARIADDGLVEILGRRDQIVNIGGERISLREIEEELSSWDEVEEAAVLVEADDIYGGRLIGFLAGGEALDNLRRKRVIARLAERLSWQKVPRHYFVLDALPKRPNGKLDRKALETKKTMDRELA